MHRQERRTKPGARRRPTAGKQHNQLDTMYGLVNKAVEELVRSEFGPAAWERIRAKAAVEEEMFISNQAYDDGITYRLVAAASEVLNLPAADILRAFGRHWVLHTARDSYGGLLEAGGKTFAEFLVNLPNFHARVELIFPDLQPPRFAILERTEQSMRLRYMTHRPGLTPFVEGLLDGLGTMFETKVTSRLVAARAEGAPHDEFLVEWQAPHPSQAP
jgi:hypothetical protein